MTHNLQSYPEFFAPTISGAKTHEVRSEGDPLSVDGDNSPFAVGDTILLHEYDPTAKTYSGRIAAVVVTWFDPAPKPWLGVGWITMSISLDRLVNRTLYAPATPAK